MPTQIVNFGTPTTGPAGTEQCQEVRVYVNRAQAQDDVRLKVTSGTICNVNPAPNSIVGALLDPSGCYTEDTPGGGFVLNFGTTSDYSFEAQDGATFAFADALSAPAFEDYWWDVDTWTAEEASSRVKGDPQESFVRATISTGTMSNATANQGVVTATGLTTIAVQHQQRTPGQVKDDVTVTAPAPAVVTELDPARGIWQVCRNEASSGTFTSLLTATNAVDNTVATAQSSFTFTGGTTTPTNVRCGPTTAITETTATVSGGADNVGAGEQITVLYGTAPGGPYPTSAGSAPAGQSGDFTFPVTGLAPNTTYYYRAVVDPLALTSTECSFTTAAAAAEFSCIDGQSGPINRHGYQWLIGAPNAANNDYDGDDFFIEHSAVGPAGPWTTSLLRTPTGEDCVGTGPNPFTTGGAGPGIATVADVVGLERGTPYWLRATHQFSASGGPEGEQIVCGPYETNDSEPLACPTASNVTQTSVDLKQSDTTTANPYYSAGCAQDEFTLEWGTTSGVYTDSDVLAPPVDPQGTTGPTHSLTGLLPGTTYFYRATLTDFADGVIQTSPECSFTTAAADNLPPTITGLDDQTGPVGTAQSDTFTVADADGTVVSVTSAPAGATLVDNGSGSWAISYTPTAVGDTTFTVTVTDDDGATATDTITFTGVAVTTPDNPFEPQPCADDTEPPPAFEFGNDVEGTLLCDIDADGNVVGTALVEGIYDEETGTRTGTRTVSVTDGSPYVAQGTLQPCSSTGLDVEVVTLCETQTNGVTVPFVRVMVFDGATGAFVSSRDEDSNGNPYTPTGSVDICREYAIGWESVCYTTTATGDEVLPGTKRHDDRFPSPGFQVFDAQGNPVSQQPGFQQVNCDQCCAVPFGEGCWANTTGSGTWTTLREADGTIIGPLDTLTGNPVAAGDIGDCPAATITTAPVNVRSHMLNLAAGQSWTQANLAGETALSVGFTVISGTANLTDSDATPTTLLPAGFSALWAVNEDANTLFAPQSIAAVGGRTVVVWTSRA